VLGETLHENQVMPYTYNSTFTRQAFERHAIGVPQ
jgi:hypothetical protein